MVPTVSAPFSLPERYRLEGPVASGGMASVWAAHDTLLDRPVAVKVLAEHLGEDAAARERFQREARAAAALSSHPNVVTIFDVGDHDGRSFIVMELCRGGTLADVLRRTGAVAPERALRWLGEAAGALDAAHAGGVVHRDIKPANLLLDEHDRLAVADFGIARLAYEAQVTATGQILGTAAYLSPEQAEGAPTTEASDRYALAVVAFELLTGTRPFQAEHFAAQARAHIEDPPPRASERASTLSPAVDDVLQRGMAKDPSQRWPSSIAFVDALAPALADRTAATKVAAPMPSAPATAVVLGEGRFTREGDTSPHQLPVAPPARPTAPRPTAPRPIRAAYPASRKDRRGLLALAALLAIAAVVVVIAVAAGGDDPGADRAAEATATPAAKARRTPTATPAAQATQAPTDAAPAAGAGDPSALNAQGFESFKAGDYAAAIAPLRQAVEACGDGGKLDPCGFALYNLGASLNRSGDPAGAIPILQQRLDRFGDNDAGDVQRELDDALAATGQGGKPGKGNGKKNRSDEGD